MKKKRRFRKIFIQCADKKAIGNVDMETFYKHRADAESNLNSRIKMGAFDLKIWDAKDKRPPSMSVEGFYLVHESLFNEVLAEHTEQKEEQ